MDRIYKISSTVDEIKQRKASSTGELQKSKDQIKQEHFKTEDIPENFCYVNVKEEIEETKTVKNSVSIDVDTPMKLQSSCEEEEKPFKCIICNCVFALNESLKRHIRTHTGERPYFCPHCDYRATQKSNLIKHLKVHNERIFKCKMCEYSTTKQKLLQNHSLAHKVEKKAHLAPRRKHSGNKSYICIHCDYCTSQPAALKKHKVMHSGEPRFKCYICDFTCVQKSVFNKHSKRHEIESNTKNKEEPTCNPVVVECLVKQETVKEEPLLVEIITSDVKVECE